MPRIERLGLKVGLAALSLVIGASVATADGGRGLRRKAKRELRRSGMTKYLGQFTPASSEPFAEDWVKHTFDSEAGEGPICIGGTDYSVFTKQGDPKKVIIFLQGGGACWENFPRCNVTAEAQFPPPAAFLPGVFRDTSPDGTIENELGKYSVVYMPYCDGSVFGGDNDVENDPVFGVRRHRGLRNLSAGMDVAKSVFPRARTLLVTGSSAGGVGAASFAPFLARFVYSNRTNLYVFNDAGPLALNPEGAPDAAQARVNDWKFDQFFPRSCKRQGLCDPLGQQTGIIKWRLANDRTVREAFFETDGDLTNLGFVQSNLPGTPPFVPVSQTAYRAILDNTHGPIHDQYPNRYKRYIVSGGNSACNGFVVYTHTALQGGNTDQLGCPGVDLFYDLEAGGIPLHEWTNAFVRSGRRDRYDHGWWWKKKRRRRRVWIDIVEGFESGPPLP